MSKTLFLIDGTNYIFRAFFAVPMMNNSKGMPTNALHGFTYMLLNLIKAEKPDYWAVAFDAKGPTFRKDQFEDYKAHRKAVAPELLEQLPYCRKICEAMRVPYFELTGYEADDIVATIVRRTRGQDVKIKILSMDKDLMQLVDDQVQLMDTLRNKEYDVAGVIEKWGVPPNRLRDLLALTGDSSDNVPGVPGIGPKKAKDLIIEFDSVPNLLENLDKVRNQKIRETLQANVDAARMSLALVTLHEEVPLDMPLEALAVQEPDPALSYELFRSLEFKRLTKDFEAKAVEAAPEAPAQATSEEQVTLRLNVKEIQEPAELAMLAGALNQCSKLSLRTLVMEGSAESAEAGSVSAGPTPNSPLAGLALSLSPTEAYFVPLADRDYGWREAVKDVLRPRLRDPKVLKFGHNLKRDIKYLAGFGLVVKGVGGDTELAAYLLNASKGEPNLAELCNTYLRRSVSMQSMAAKLGEEAACVLPVHDKLVEALDAVEMGGLYRDVEAPLVEVLARMELLGIRVDVPHLSALGTEFEGRIADAEARIHTIAGEKFNPSSPKQLQVILFEKLKLPVIKRTKTGPSTDQEVLENLAESHDLPAEILAYRSLVKLKGTYLDALPKLVDKKSRLHTTLHQAVTATGRLSSTDPNLQNIPVRGEEGKRIREAFVPTPGNVLVSADYSQIELRLLAHFCGDETLVYAFTHGLDIHAATAADMFGIPLASVTSEMRRSAKAINFGILYGMGAFRLARELKIARKDAERYIEQYFTRYAKVKGFLEGTLDEARTLGYVKTLYNRRRYLPDLSASNFNVRQGAERMAINTPIQGTAADIIKIAMRRVADALEAQGLLARMLLQVHDELIFDVPVDELEAVRALVKAEMEGVASLAVPLTVEVGSGESWAAAH